MSSDDESFLRYTLGRQTLDLDTLESHFRKATDIFRGSIDVADYKNYKFRLLFLKRINNRSEEETEKTAEEYDIDNETVCFIGSAKGVGIRSCFTGLVIQFNQFVRSTLQ